MTDRIEQAIVDHDAEDLASALQAAGVECSTDLSAPAQPGVEVPGYGLVYWDDQPGVEPGWIVRTGDAPEMTQHDEPVSEDELADDLRDLVRDVEKLG